MHQVFLNVSVYTKHKISLTWPNRFATLEKQPFWCVSKSKFQTFLNNIKDVFGFLKLFQKLMFFESFKTGIQMSDYLCQNQNTYLQRKKNENFLYLWLFNQTLYIWDIYLCVFALQILVYGGLPVEDFGFLRNCGWLMSHSFSGCCCSTKNP